MPAAGESHCCKQAPLHACMLFVDMKEAFDRVPRDVIWWAMHKLGIDVWLVRLVQSIYTDVRSRIRICAGYSEEFLWALVFLSLLLCINFVDALSRFRAQCPWELLYADDLMVSAEPMKDRLVKVQTWKSEIEKKDLRVNMEKTMIRVSGIKLAYLPNLQIVSPALMSILLAKSKIRWHLF